MVFNDFSFLSELIRKPRVMVNCSDESCPLSFSLFWRKKFETLTVEYDVSCD